MDVDPRKIAHRGERAPSARNPPPPDLRERLQPDRVEPLSERRDGHAGRIEDETPPEPPDRRVNRRPAIQNTEFTEFPKM